MSSNKDRSASITTEDRERYELAMASRFEDFIQFYTGQLTAIMPPVVLTMIAVVILITSLEPTEEERAAFGELFVYNEQPSDSTGARIWGALLNALVAVVFITVMTFVMVMLYKYNCTKVIIVWLGWSVFTLIGLFSALLVILLADRYNWAVDWVSLLWFELNFTTVGLLSVFWHVPLKVHQGYLVIISSFLANYLARISPFTGYALLIGVALYDIFAVLSPVGPLKLLIDTSNEKAEPIPALLYTVAGWMIPIGVVPTMAPLMARADDDDGDKEDAEVQEPEDVQVENDTEANNKAVDRGGIRLGLGDFIFYAVLVGLAALSEFSAVFTSMIALVAGLCLTLGFLAIFRQALPALPFSIFFGLLYVGLTVWTLTPFLVQLGRQATIV